MDSKKTQRVLVVGGGFGGLSCARKLGSRKGVEVTLVDQRNHHLFQPLLYQVAMAGLSPADIAVPIRSLLSQHENIRVMKATVERIDPELRSVHTSAGPLEYDYLVLAAGAKHTYFGHDHWESHAPGLKTLAQATEIRRRVLDAFEKAETASSADERRAYLTFVVVGGGPTGVELAGALGEMSRYTLAKDFRRIDPRLTRVILIEAGPRILGSFDRALSAAATRDLERLGVQVWTETRVSHLDENGVTGGGNHVGAKTVLWAAGVQASPLGAQLGAKVDGQGRVLVEEDLSIRGRPEIFVIGDQAHTTGPSGGPLPGVATVALQQGRAVAALILAEMKGESRKPFRYFDKGQMATIGRSRAVLEAGGFRLSGFLAWLSWLLVHIYYLSGFKNRLLVLIQWAWSYVTFARGARLIVEPSWRLYGFSSSPSQESSEPP